MTGSRTVAAGIVLIALTNVVVLGGVAWNRSGDPEATLRLSQRELRPSDSGYGRRENSGLALNLQWRVLEKLSGNAQIYAWRFAGKGGSPAWLDKAKLDALGFDTAPAPGLPGRRGRTRLEKQLPRQALIVLELDGPTWRRSLELAAQFVAREEARLAARPGDKKIAAQAQNARAAFEQESTRNSRLFAVDAGLDAAALRAKYPDTNRYAIASGRVRLMHANKPDAVRGYVEAIDIDTLNVPLALRGVFETAAQANIVRQRNSARFEARVAFGKRFEPWITGAARK